jgi:hypothetical protein
LFVLENTIPYIPATVYHDPDLNVAWTNPIQFLGNGTLPVDIYFESETVYRLEFRQGPTQAGPLIYEVNNYVAGSGGSTPIDTIALSSSNQITNPQFALMSLENPVTIGDTNPDPIEIAPGWTLLLSGTGSVTITQVPLNNSNVNPSNAPYALRLTMSGWTADSVILRQRFEQNGMLWANKIVSSTITTRLDGSPQSITANLVDSNNSVLGTVLPLTPINEDWNEYTGYAELLTSTNPNTPPVAYIDYLLHLPSNIDIYITSFQLVVQELPLEPSFEQDSINRQIDHSYNYAYPIVPVGSIIDYAGYVTPPHYYSCDGLEKDRVRDYLLFNAITSATTVTLTSGNNTFSEPGSGNYYIGMSIEGDGIPPGTTVINIVVPIVTMSANATITGPSFVRVFPWGNGNGSTTFNLPELRGYVRAGSNGVTFGGASIGFKGGSATHTLTIAEMPAHDHPGSVAEGSDNDTGNGRVEFQGDFTGTVPIVVASQGGGAAHNIVQPTALVKTLIRYQ